MRVFKIRISRSRRIFEVGYLEVEAANSKDAMEKARLSTELKMEVVNDTLEGLSFVSMKN